jgi:DNA-binding CsgD family transcriptional regulator
LALQALRGAAPLQLSGGRLCPADPGDRDALCAALADALHGRRTLLTLGGGDQALSVAVVPIDDGQQALALLVLNKPQSCTALSLDFYARANGLTNAETTVLACLSQGVKPKDIAQQLGVAISTVRSQIASIRAKTQTASIPELAGRVAALPPFTSALKWERGDWDDAALRGHQRPSRGAPQRVPLQPRFADAC